VICDKGSFTSFKVKKPRPGPLELSTPED